MIRSFFDNLRPSIYGTFTKSLKNLHDILLIPDPFNGTLLPVALLLTTTEVDCDVASELGDVTGRKDVFMLANTVSRCFGSKYCCIIAR